MTAGKAGSSASIGVNNGGFATPLRLSYALDPPR
jgi:hypothetical protein